MQGDDYSSYFFSITNPKVVSSNPFAIIFTTPLFSIKFSVK